MADIDPTNLTALTVDLLSAYVANNTVDSAELSGLIRSTHEALKGIDTPAAEAPAEPEFKAAVTARKSLASDDHIISLIDGKPYKTLKRHLSGHGLTPAEYRERYKLPRDYPMVAPSYSQQRREVAAKLGLGRKPQAVVSKVETAIETPVIEATPPTPETKAVPKAKSAAKALAAPKRTARKAPASATEATPAPAEVAASAEPAAPKKRGPKPKIMASAPAKPAAKKPAAKRAPRKPKDSPEPSAS